MSEKEKHVFTFNLSDLEDWAFLSGLPGFLYNGTGVKWSVSFDGSKGYTDHISFSAEGSQADDNETRIYLNKELLTKTGNFRKGKKLAVFYSWDKGVRLAIV